MRTYDLSPLFRSSVGFDRVSRLLEASQAADPVTYPPYNIENTGENAYRLTVAVAGFAADELDVTVKENELLVTGKSKKDEASTAYLHRGIASRAFERRFQLADTIKVTGASYENGLLNIELVREVPEHKKPRKVEIGQGLAQHNMIEGQKLAAE